MATKTTTAKKIPATPPAKKVTPAADKPRKSKPHEIVLSSNALNAVSMDAWGKFAGEINFQELADTLGEQTKNVQDGDMRPVEGMLYRQAKTLETMFTSLARRAAGNDGLKQFQVNLMLALKAQAQCRATLEALAEIKNPRSVAFVKQANIANGPQQVNNGTALAQPTHARETQPHQNELLEDHRHGSTHLDTRATTKAARSYQEVATVEAVHRTQKHGG